MSRTPLFSAVRRALRLARIANRKGAPPADELPGLLGASLDRRRFLAAAGGGALAFAATQLPSVSGADAHRRRDQPRIVVVGGGMAGLHCAWRLKRRGLRAEVYEASSRTGGRIFTRKGLMGPKLTTELGGEFIDSGHADMLHLARQFDLKLVDTQARSQRRLVDELYFFGGRQYSVAEVIAAFQPLAAQMDADLEGLGEVVDYTDDGGAGELDHLSIAEYLELNGVTGFLRDLLDAAYTTEYGLDIADQSSLNLLFLIGTDTSAGEFAVFGESDERYKIKGGNQRVVDELADRLGDRIHTGHRLEAIAPAGDGFTLTFEDANGVALDVPADIAVLAIPFTMLRNVDVRVELPEVKRRAIAELGYGTNAKLMLGFDRRVWLDQGNAGEAFSDEAYQLAWDNSRQQKGRAGGLTLFSGGQPGLAVGEGTPGEQAARMMPGLERTFPGISAAHNGRVARMHWPTHPFTMGSYASYKPGQWTGIAGAEIETVGNLYFAGEHCSADFQGYMNGAAETGRVAAAAILAAV